MIQNVIFGILFLKILFRAYNLFIIVQTFHWTSSRVFFNLRFSSRKSQSQQKLAEKITHFTIQFRSKNLTHFTNLSSLDIGNNIHPQHSQKTFWPYRFSSKHVSVWCQKKYLYYTISWRPRTESLKNFENKCFFVSIYLLKKIFVPET